MNEYTLSRMLARQSADDVPVLVDTIRQLVRDRDYWRDMVVEQQNKRFDFVTKSLGQFLSVYGKDEMPDMQAMRDELNEVKRLFQDGKTPACAVAVDAQSPTSPVEPCLSKDSQGDVL